MEFKKCSIGGTLYQEAGSKDELPLGCKVTPQHPYHPLPTCTNLHQPRTAPCHPLSTSYRPLTTPYHPPTAPLPPLGFKATEY